ncbi:MAG: acylphosphatase, partial [Halobacteriota archaeon]
MRITALVHGDVQRVGYRSRVVTIARAFGLKGCVHNLPDGRVKVTAEGDKESLERFVKAIKISNALIRVDRIDYKYSEPTGEFDSFYKLVDEGETDERLDTAAEYLKELVDVTRNGFSDLKEVIIDESQKTRDVVRDESQKTRDVVRDESQKTRDEL